MLIFGISVGVPTLKGLCDTQCAGYCSFDGFDLACHCQVPVIKIDVDDGWKLSGHHYHSGDSYYDYDLNSDDANR